MGMLDNIQRVQKIIISKETVQPVVENNFHKTYRRQCPAQFNPVELFAYFMGCQIEKKVPPPGGSSSQCLARSCCINNSSSGGGTRRDNGLYTRLPRSNASHKYLKTLNSAFPLKTEAATSWRKKWQSQNFRPEYIFFCAARDETTFCASWDNIAT
jgi:hypothetical protein